jgi:hypothetical protein
VFLFFSSLLFHSFILKFSHFFRCFTVYSHSLFVLVTLKRKGRRKKKKRGKSGVVFGLLWISTVSTEYSLDIAIYGATSCGVRRLRSAGDLRVIVCVIVCRLCTYSVSLTSVLDCL